MRMVGPPRNKGPSEGGVVTQVPVIQEVSLEKVREVSASCLARDTLG